jgi:antirestriction protein ArdC
MVKEPPLYSSEPLRSPEAAVKVIADMLRQYDREAFCIVNLRNDLSPINMNIVSTGTLNASLAHPREILKSAVLSNASATMLFHNHPSGNLTPSQEDIEITDRMSKLFAMAEMPLLDHIIIGNGDQYYSFKENSIMPIGTQMFARDPAEIKFENVAEPVVSEKRGSYHMTPEQRQEKIKQITDKLEQGVHQIFESDNYRAYLSTMAKFHSYSLNNTILIAMQKPGATLVAGYTAWQKDHDRHVKKGEKGIQIIAPSPYKVKQERDALDPKTGKPQMDAQGNPLKEIIEVERPAFKVATVFDISQTEGKELPSIGVNELSGGVEGYDALFDALKATCPVPIAFEDIPSGAKGYYHTEDHRIALQEGMSQMQTVKTLIHEMSHERMHSHEKEKPVEERLSRRSMEVEAESVAFVVGTALSAEHPELKLDFSDYSFGYIAGWSSGKETAELKASLGRIQATASEMISEIEGHLQELQKSEQLQAVDGIDQKAAAMEPVKLSVVAEPSVIDKPSILANLHKEMPKTQKPAVSKGKEECL